MAMKIDSELGNLDYEETIKLIVKSSELSVKTACAVATLPIKCYVKALTCWSEAVSETWEKCCADPCDDEIED